MKVLPRLRLYALALLAGTPFIAGCQHLPRIDVAQVCYEMLRTNDCQRNDLESFCGRSYATDYHEYVQVRQDFLNDGEQTTLRLTPPAEAHELHL